MFDLLCGQVWVAYQLSRLKRGDDTGAREALKRSLQSLARHKHVSVISRYGTPQELARDDFCIGSCIALSTYLEM